MMFDIAYSFWGSLIALVFSIWFVPYAWQKKRELKITMSFCTLIWSLTMAGSAFQLGTDSDIATESEAETAYRVAHMPGHYTARELETLVNIRDTAVNDDQVAAAKSVLFNSHLQRQISLRND